ncbi:MAG: GTPase HflX, partial [Deltaproteobacteria bacterium]|nr:GTPase HflX [Deltaproteobacteria bacterium]
MKKIFGTTLGLKSNQIRRLENLYRRRIPTEFLVTPELSREICSISHEIRRQIGLLVNRLGRIAYVIIGKQQGIIIPDTSEYRTAPGRLKGLRCIHTHLKSEPLDRDDITDLALLRLDLMAAVTINEEGLPDQIYMGHIMPGVSDENSCRILPAINNHQLEIGCLDLIQALEEELSQSRALYDADSGRERALLVSVTTASRKRAEDSLAELKELAESGGIDVVETILQQRVKADSRFLMGLGKLQELAILALQKGSTIIIFDQELNPSQVRSITDQIDLKVIDRTQLILDIFAQRAQTREGKLQVELAQLKYLLPRLITKNTAM